MKLGPAACRATLSTVCYAVASPASIYVIGSMPGTAAPPSRSCDHCPCRHVQQVEVAAAELQSGAAACNMLSHQPGSYVFLVLLHSCVQELLALPLHQGVLLSLSQHTTCCTPCWSRLRREHPQLQGLASKSARRCFLHCMDVQPPISQPVGGCCRRNQYPGAAGAVQCSKGSDSAICSAEAHAPCT